MSLILTRAHVNELSRLAQETFPEECCGLLVGEGRRVTRVVATRNVRAGSRLDRFEIDPAAHIRLQRELRGTNQKIIGCFHSHPGGMALPSETDRSEANDPSLLWLIIAVQNRENPPVMRVFEFDGRDFRALALCIGD